MMAALAATAAMTACQQENLEPDVQEQEGVTVRVVASLSEETKASLSDNDYLKWEINDGVLARGYNSIGGLIQIDGGKILSIDEESNTAVYEFTGVPAGAKLWLGHNANNPTAKKFEFARFHNAFSQTDAGQINKENLMLVSEMVSIPADSETTVELNTQMKIVGSIVRFLVYSSTGVDEQLLSVKLEVADQNISGNNSGCLAYYFNTDGTYKYWAEDNENSLTDTPAIFWGKNFKYTQTMLDNPYSLNGVTEPTAGSGVYLPVAPLSGVGYKYTVVTDKATYTFDAPESNYAFADNQLKNVLLNLDKATTKEEGVALKTITFFGGVGDTVIEAEECTKKFLNYCVITVDNIYAEDWANDSRNEQALYGNVTITPYVFGTGVGEGATVADWLRVYYGTDENGKFNTTHIFLDAEANNGAERKALVYCEYKAPEGYQFADKSTMTYKQFIITQKAKAVEIVADLTNSYGEVVPASGADITLGTLALTVDGETAADVAAAMTQYGVTVTANNGATVEVAADGTVTMDVPANPYANGGKEYTVTVKHNGNPLATATVNQAAGEDEAQESLYEFTPSLSHAWGASWGFGNDFAHTTTGHYLTVSGVKVDGNVAAFTNSPEDKELGLKLLNIAFKSHEPSVDEIASVGHAGYTPVIVSFAVIECVGDTVRGAYVMGDGHSITKITGYSPNGTEIGSVFFWID